MIIIHRKYGTGLIVMSALLLIVLFILEWKNVDAITAENTEPVTAEAMETDSREHALFYAAAEVNGQVYEFEAWEKQGDSYFLFLPGWMKQSAAEIFVGKDVALNGEKMLSGNSFYMEDERESFDIAGNPISLQVMYSSSMPTLWVETQDDELDKIDADKAYEGTIYFTLFDEKGKIVAGGGKNQKGVMRARGNVSFDIAAKKSYLIESENKVNLMSMGEAEKWVLISNYFDQTALRNYLTTQLAMKMGLEYTPEMEFIDLYVDGDYRGMYLLSEKVEVDPERVNVRDLEAENEEKNGNVMLKKYPWQTADMKGFRAASPADISGGYLVEFELDERWGDEVSGFVTDGGQCVVIQNPKHATVGEVNYISGIFQNLEDALLESDTDRYLDYIDLESFANKYLIEELTKNIDANKSSQYFYKYDDSISTKIFAGPIWDYDKGWGNGGKLDKDLDLKDPEGLYANRAIYEHSIWYEMCSKETFYDYVKQKYCHQVVPWLNDILDGEIGVWKKQIYDSAMMDWMRWDEERQQDARIDEQKFVSDYEEAYQILIDFIVQRRDFLLSEWSDSKEKTDAEAK